MSDIKAISTHILTRRMTEKSIKHQLLSFYFNSHPHKEDDTINMTIFFSNPLFQLTSSQGGWHNIVITKKSPKRNFNSHPHKEDDHAKIEVNRDKAISTHILTRRMTSGRDFTDHNADISTHILTRRMTSLNTEGTKLESFQLTSSQGGWHVGLPKDVRDGIFQRPPSQGVLPPGAPMRV